VIFFRTPPSTRIVPQSVPHFFKWLYAHFCEPPRTQILLKLLIYLNFSERGSSGRAGGVGNWLPPRDSNPDMLLQRQLSYH
jgi:hypothetical protein